MCKVLIILLTLAGIFFAGCGDDIKTPEDIKGTVAWLDASSALPVFPFGTNPIYIYICSDHDQFSYHMDEHVFKRPEIIKYMNKHLTCIKVMPDSLISFQFMGETLTILDFLKALQAKTYPSHYFFDRSGNLKGAREGFISIRDFKRLLKYVAEGYVEKYSFEEFMNMPESEMDTVWGDF